MPAPLAPARKHTLVCGLVLFLADLIWRGVFWYAQVLPQRQLLMLGGAYAVARTMHSLQIRYSGLPMLFRAVGFLFGILALFGMGSMLMLHCYSQLFSK
jgi:hypothetical protein